MSSVLIIDDHPAIRVAIRALLTQSSEFTDIYDAIDGQQGLSMLAAHPVDVAIIDIELPGYDGFALLKKIQKAYPTTRTLFLSAKNESVYACRAIQAGANGFISKNKDINDILFATQNVLRGYAFFPSKALNLLAGNSVTNDPLDRAHSLTSREINVLRYLVNGFSNKQIADEMFISNKTVSTYKTRILTKLGLTSVIELANYAHEHHLV